ncbi:MAG: DNA methyltransferase [Pseudonocardiaceae bacterium]
MPWRVAFALQSDGWILRNAIVWHKPNAMPEPVRDRLSTRYEMLFLFTAKQQSGSTWMPSANPWPGPRRSQKAS